MGDDFEATGSIVASVAATAPLAFVVVEAGISKNISSVDSSNRGYTCCVTKSLRTFLRSMCSTAEHAVIAATLHA